MRECVETMSASRDQLATDTSPTRDTNNSKTEPSSSGSLGSESHPDQKTPAKSADYSGTLPLEMENVTHQALYEMSVGQTESTLPPTKRISWDVSTGFTGILDSDRIRWRKSFPRVKINTELRIMHEWLLSNPRKRKKNYYRFISSWLSRCQDVGGSSGMTQPAHCSGVWKSTPLTEKQIENATSQNEKPGGACEKLEALKRFFRKEITEEELDRIVQND